MVIIVRNTTTSCRSLNRRKKKKKDFPGLFSLSISPQAKQSSLNSFFLFSFGLFAKSHQRQGFGQHPRPSVPSLLSQSGVFPLRKVSLTQETSNTCSTFCHHDSTGGLCMWSTHSFTLLLRSAHGALQEDSGDLGCGGPQAAIRPVATLRKLAVPHIHPAAASRETLPLKPSDCVGVLPLFSPFTAKGGSFPPPSRGGSVPPFAPSPAAGIALPVLPRPPSRVPAAAPAPLPLSPALPQRLHRKAKPTPRLRPAPPGPSRLAAPVVDSALAPSRSRLQEEAAEKEGAAAARSPPGLSGK